MSALDAVFGGLSAVQSFVSAFTGQGALQLGDMTLTDFELPERIRFGGRQSIKTHNLPGGARVLDDMGDDPAPIDWSGLFLGMDAQSRAVQMDAMRTAGQPVLLSWGQYAFTVMIADCEFQYGFGRTEYRISCIVIPDVPEDTGSAQDATVPGNGDGSQPATPTQARATTTSRVARVRSINPALPVPPIPPVATSNSAGQG
ncbi:MAG: hypothetical protein NVSMB20_03130 [Bradyrhizobium sp.]